MKRKQQSLLLSIIRMFACGWLNGFAFVSFHSGIRWPCLILMFCETAYIQQEKTGPGYEQQTSYQILEASFLPFQYSHLFFLLAALYWLKLAPKCFILIIMGMMLCYTVKYGCSWWVFIMIKEYPTIPGKNKRFYI